MVIKMSYIKVIVGFKITDYMCIKLVVILFYPVIVTHSIVNYFFIEYFCNSIIAMVVVTLLCKDLAV